MRQHNIWCVCVLCGEVCWTAVQHTSPHRNLPGTHFHYGLSRPQAHGTVGRNMSLKNPVTPRGINPVTVRLVAQRLKHYATPGPSRLRDN